MSKLPLFAGFLVFSALPSPSFAQVSLLRGKTCIEDLYCRACWRQEIHACVLWPMC